MCRHHLLLRPILAAVALAAVVISGFVYGALSTVCADTGPDW